MTNLRLYFSDTENRLPLFSVLLGGYSVTLALWQLLHRSTLEEYVLFNELPPSSDGPTLLLLAAGMLVALLVWTVLGLVVSTRFMLPLAHVMGRLSALFLACTLLPLLFVLSLPGFFPLHMEDSTRAFLLVLITVVMAFIVGGVLLMWARYSHHDSDSSRYPTHHIAQSVVVLMIAGYIAVMSVLVLTRHESLNSNAFDLGIQDQAMYAILEHGYPRVTIYNSGPINPVTSEIAFEFQNGPVNQFQ